MPEKKPKRIQNSYYFLSSSEGELMLVMDTLKGNADDDNARFIYDKNWEGYLVRNPKQNIDIPLIPEQYCGLLSHHRTMLVTEMDGDEITDVYEAGVIRTEEQRIKTSCEFICNGEGELMLIMKAIGGEADDENAHFIYDENGDAYLLRSPTQTIDFSFIPEAARKLLSETKILLVTEMEGEAMADVYEAKVSSREALLTSLIPQDDDVDLVLQKLKEILRD